MRQSGGICLTLDFVSNHINEVIAIPVIQFIIGDCKWNDMLYGRMGVHTLQMKGLCRECDIPPKDGDDLCIDKELKCRFHTKETIVGKSQEELNHFSSYGIRNCFSNIGCTPVEMLHTVLLCLCDYIADGMKLTFTNSSISEMSNTTAGICKDARCQSERDNPYLGHLGHLGRD